MRELRRVGALVLAFAVLTATLLAGHRYFYCAPMARIAATDCCAPEAHAHAATRATQATPALDAPKRHCCVDKTFDAGDRGTSVAPPSVPAAPPALASAFALAQPPTVPGLVAPRGAHDSRAGPPRAGPLVWRTPIDVSLS